MEACNGVQFSELCTKNIMKNGILLLTFGHFSSIEHYYGSQPANLKILRSFYALFRNGKKRNNLQNRMYSVTTKRKFKSFVLYNDPSWKVFGEGRIIPPYDFDTPSSIDSKESKWVGLRLVQ